MLVPYMAATGRIAQLYLWRPPMAMKSRVFRDRDDPARPPIVVLSYGTSRLKIAVDDDVEIAEVYRALEQYAAILRRRHRESRRLFHARYAPN